MLNITRSGTDRQWSCCNRGVMWSNRRRAP